MTESTTTIPTSAEARQAYEAAQAATAAARIDADESRVGIASGALARPRLREAERRLREAQEAEEMARAALTWAVRSEGAAHAAKRDQEAAALRALRAQCRAQAVTLLLELRDLWERSLSRTEEIEIQLIRLRDEGQSVEIATLPSQLAKYHRPWVAAVQGLVNSMPWPRQPAPPTEVTTNDD
jgi:hypothetical protein